MDDLAGTRAVTLLGTTRAQGGEHRLPLGGNSPYEPIIRTGDKMPPSPCPSRPCDPPIPLSSGGGLLLFLPLERSGGDTEKLSGFIMQLQICMLILYRDQGGWHLSSFLSGCNLILSERRKGASCPQNSLKTQLLFALTAQDVVV